MNAGDVVRLKCIPPGIRDDEDLKTRSLFETCIGRTFVVAGIDRPEGVPQPLVRLDVGHVLGKPDYLHRIWVEQEFVEPASPDSLDTTLTVGKSPTME